jgi:hypothetical protein
MPLIAEHQNCHRNGLLISAGCWCANPVRTAPFMTLHLEFVRG